MTERPPESPPVVVLEAGSSLADQLAMAGLAVRRATGLDELGGMAAAVVDPEAMPGRWPMDVAEEAVRHAGGSLPVVLVCRSEVDAATIRARGVGAAAVLVRGRLAAGDLAAVVRGELARWQA
jgi:hypothetical protein